MAFEVSHTGLSDRLDDRAFSVTTNTLEVAQDVAKQLKEQGFHHIIIFDDVAKKTVKIQVT